MKYIGEYNYQDLAINLSKLDFKYTLTSNKYVHRSAINLSKLDFKLPVKLSPRYIMRL